MALDELDDEPLRPDDPRVRDEIEKLLSLPKPEVERLDDVWAIYLEILKEKPSTDPDDTYGLIQESFQKANLKYNRGYME